MQCLATHSKCLAIAPCPQRCAFCAAQVQLRIPAEQCIGRHLYRRGDATLAYFYTTEELAGLAVAAGLEVVECEYVCVVNRNRKTGQALRRAFVHGVFRNPLQ
jgi:hypothetical protein